MPSSFLNEILDSLHHLEIKLKNKIVVFPIQTSFDAPYCPNNKNNNIFLKIQPNAFDIHWCPSWHHLSHENKKFSFLIQCTWHPF
jgi:hypothetical protein